MEFVRAEDAGEVWSFRNGFEGHFPRTHPPTDWAENRNVVWKFTLARKSNASPLIVGDSVFVLEEPGELICLNKSNGSLRWQRTNTREELLGSQPPSKQNDADWISEYGFTTPTPVSDGRRIWCVFGCGIVVCYDLAGKRLWTSQFDATDKISGCAVSPCLIDGVIIVGGKGADRLCGFDAATGRKLWRTDEGSQEGSCRPVTLNARTFALASAGLLLDPQSGEICQRGMLGAGFQGDEHRFPVNWGPTVALDGDIAIFHVHFQPDQYNTAFRAVRIGREGFQPLWEYYANTDSNIRGRMGNSPVVVDGLMYAVKDGGLLEVFETQTGRRVYAHQLPRHSYASLAYAGGNIYAFGSSIVTIFNSGRTYNQVAQFKHGFHDFIASPAFQDRRLYFRDAGAIWCIEEAPKTSAVTASTGAHALSDDGPDLSDTARNAPLLVP